MTSTPQKKSCTFWIALGFWLLVFLMIVGDAVVHPRNHTTMPTYRLASTQWWAGQDPYTTNDHSGFLYFPQAAVIFTPFNLLPFYAGEVLWRLATFGIFAYALTRLNEFFIPHDKQSSIKTFLILSLLAVPSSFASLRNAQFDLPLASLILLTAAEVARERWNTAALWICLGVALKPLAVVPLLLFTALNWKLIPRVIVGMLIVIALPFLHWNPAYVAHEYFRCFETLVRATKADEPRYSELAALISHIGIYPPDWLKFTVRIICAVIYLGLGFAAMRRLRLAHAAWVIGALSTDYLMLFNPRTETCSYVFLGPFVASLAVYFAQQPGRKLTSYLLGFAALCFACDAFPKIAHFSIHEMTDRWLKPFVALLFLPVLIQFIFAPREKATE